MDSFLFFEVKMFEKCSKCHISRNYGHFEPYDPLKGPLQFQKSKFTGLYSTKSLHKLILSENRFFSIYFEVEILLGSPKVDVERQNLPNSDLIRAIKFGKVL